MHRLKLAVFPVLLFGCAVGSAQQPCDCPSAGAAAPATATAPDTDKPLKPLLAGVPEYPGERQPAGAGYVDIEFTVTADGIVESPRVVTAEPAGWFDEAALASVSRWRYPAAQGREPLTLRERIEFAPARVVSPTASRIVRALPPGAPRNHCIREGATFHFGDVVDVALQSACAETLVVFACAPGTGRSTGRWVCSSSEERASLLVQPGDARLHTRADAGEATGIRRFELGDEFAVTRPPNAEFWWVACTTDDSACRGNAQLWSRSLHGQPASADPQARATIAVARSY